MTSEEKLARLQKYIKDHYKPEFNFELEYRKNDDSGDSYYYGVDTGQQYVYEDVKRILEK